MSDDLIHEMSTRLGRTGPEVEKAFAAFASAVQDRVRSEGEANLAGLGVIRREAGGPKFEPSEALSQAVNYRWLSAGAPVAAASARPASALSVVPPGTGGHPEPESTSSAKDPTASGPESDVDSGSEANAPISVDLPPELLEEPPMPDDQKPIRKVSWAPIDEVDPTDLSSSKKAPEPSTPVSRPAAAAAAPKAAPTKTDPPTSRPAVPVNKPVVSTPKAPTPARAASPPPPPPPPPAGAFMPPGAPAQGSAAAPTRPPAPPSPATPVEDLTYESMHPQPVAPGSAAAASGAVARAAAQQSKAGSRRPVRRSDSSDSSFRNPLLIVIGLLAIVAVGWVLINQFVGASDEAESTPALTENAASNPVIESGDPEVDPAGASTDPGTTPEAQPPPTVAPQAASGIDPNSSGYTLIVGSSTSRSGAETEMNRFSNLGHPVALLSYPDGDGQTRHRIAVGEFATADAADSARRAMASRLPNGTWVRRIRR